MIGRLAAVVRADRDGQGRSCLLGADAARRCRPSLGRLDRPALVRSSSVSYQEDASDASDDLSADDEGLALRRAARYRGLDRGRVVDRHVGREVVRQLRVAGDRRRTAVLARSR